MFVCDKLFFCDMYVVENQTILKGKIRLKLVMLGIDYKRSSLDVREKFAVTKSGAEEILNRFINDGANGCVIISTCNRTEIYASVQGDKNILPAQILCDALGRDFLEHSQHFTQREGEDIMAHLCRVACGLDSQILGDDQIITQVREALELSRTYGYTDNHIETMFNISISAAKIIKTNVLSRLLTGSSVPEKTVEKIKTIYSPVGKNVLVIGNGKIGRRVAELLVKEGANVTVTLRSRKKTAVQIPDDVETISYDDRYAALEKSDIIISATASPHLTICKDKVIMLNRVPKLFFDLAVPRDVEPTVANIQGVTLFTIDNILGAEKLLPQESVFAAEEIIDEHIAKYHKWISFKDNRRTNKITSTGVAA